MTEGPGRTGPSIIKCLSLNRQPVLSIQFEIIQGPSDCFQINVLYWVHRVEAHRKTGNRKLQNLRLPVLTKPILTQRCAPVKRISLRNINVTLFISPAHRKGGWEAMAQLQLQLKRKRGVILFRQRTSSRPPANRGPALPPSRGTPRWSATRTGAPPPGIIG